MKGRLSAVAGCYSQREGVKRKTDQASQQLVRRARIYIFRPGSAVAFQRRTLFLLHVVSCAFLEATNPLLSCSDCCPQLFVDKRSSFALRSASHRRCCHVCVQATLAFFPAVPLAFSCHHPRSQLIASSTCTLQPGSLLLGCRCKWARQPISRGDTAPRCLVSS